MRRSKPQTKSDQYEKQKKYVTNKHFFRASISKIGDRNFYAEKQIFNDSERQEYISKNN